MIENRTKEKIVKSIAIECVYICDICGDEGMKDKELLTFLPTGWFEIYNWLGESHKVHICDKCSNYLVDLNGKLFLHKKEPTNDQPTTIRP